VDSLCFHPLGEYFASSATDHTIRIWDIKRKGCIQSIPERQADRIQFSPDGHWIVTQSQNHVGVRVWDLTAGRLIHEILHDELVSDFFFHPRELVMGTVTISGALYVWDLETFQVIYQSGNTASDYPASSASYRGVFSADGNYAIITSSTILQVYEWENMNLCSELDVMLPSPVQDAIVTDQNNFIAASVNRSYISIFTGNVMPLALSAVLPSKCDVELCRSDGSIRTPTQGNPSLSSLNGLPPLPPISNIGSQRTVSESELLCLVNPNQEDLDLTIRRGYTMVEKPSEISNEPWIRQEPEIIEPVIRSFSDFQISTQDHPSMSSENTISPILQRAQSESILVKEKPSLDVSNKETETESIQLQNISTQVTPREAESTFPLFSMFLM
jgi:hypothetical protein